MNLAIISGTLGPITEGNVFKRNDGVTVVDGHLKKCYFVNGSLKETRFFYTISGNRADEFLDNYHEGDKVVMSGKMISREDSDGRYWFTIGCTSVAKLDPSEGDL